MLYACVGRVLVAELFHRAPCPRPPPPAALPAVRYSASPPRPPAFPALSRWSPRPPAFAVRPCFLLSAVFLPSSPRRCGVLAPAGASAPSPVSGFTGLLGASRPPFIAPPAPARASLRPCAPAFGALASALPLQPSGAPRAEPLPGCSPFRASLSAPSFYQAAAPSPLPLRFRPCLHPLGFRSVSWYPHPVPPICRSRLLPGLLASPVCRIPPRWPVCRRPWRASTRSFPCRSWAAAGWLPAAAVLAGPRNGTPRTSCSPAGPLLTGRSSPRPRLRPYGSPAWLACPPGLSTDGGRSLSAPPAARFGCAWACAAPLAPLVRLWAPIPWRALLCTRAPGMLHGRVAPASALGPGVAACPGGRLRMRPIRRLPAAPLSGALLAAAPALRPARLPACAFSARFPLPAACRPPVAASGEAPRRSRPGCRVRPVPCLAPVVPAFRSDRFWPWPAPALPAVFLLRKLAAPAPGPACPAAPTCGPPLPFRGPPLRSKSTSAHAGRPLCACSPLAHSPVFAPPAASRRFLRRF